MKKLLLLSLLAFAACKKTDSGPTLPGPSSTGQNYLAFKVNENVHVYNGIATYNQPNGTRYIRFSKEIYISGNEDGNNDYIAIYLLIQPDSCKINTDYVFGSETNESFAKYTFKRPGQVTAECRTIAGSGWVRFSRLDTAVAAGTFALTAYMGGQQGADSVIINDGRFDISSK